MKAFSIAAVAALLATPTPLNAQGENMQDIIQKVAPALGKYTDESLLGDVWKRPGLSPRDRSIVTLAALVARNQTIELPHYLDPGPLAPGSKHRHPGRAGGSQSDDRASALP